MKFGILDYLTEATVEQEVLGSEAQIKCFVCTDESQLPDEISTLTALMVWHTVTLTSKTLRRLDACRAIIRVGVGFDNVDCVSAGELGIPVVNIPDYGTNDVADHALSLLLAANRKLLVYDEAIRRDPVSGWDPDIAIDARRLTNSTLGIVGLGRIGMAVAMRAKAFGMQVMFYDPYLPDGYDKALQMQRCDSLEEMVTNWKAFSERTTHRFTKA